MGRVAFQVQRRVLSCSLAHAAFCWQHCAAASERAHSAAAAQSKLLPAGRRRAGLGAPDCRHRRCLPTSQAQTSVEIHSGGRVMTALRYGMAGATRAARAASTMTRLHTFLLRGVPTPSHTRPCQQRSTSHFCDQKQAISSPSFCTCYARQRMELRSCLGVHYRRRNKRTPCICHDGRSPPTTEKDRSKSSTKFRQVVRRLL